MGEIVTLYFFHYDGRKKEIEMKPFDMRRGKKSYHVLNDATDIIPFTKRRRGFNYIGTERHVLAKENNVVYLEVASLEKAKEVFVRFFQKEAGKAEKTAERCRKNISNIMEL